MKAGAASTLPAAAPWTSVTSASVPLATGATRVTASAAVVAARLPAALVAVTRQVSSVRSSAATGT